MHKAIDSRDCTLPNKELIAEWIETYGVDSDFVRVRVRGLPPAADELQFIDRSRIKEAQEREPQSLDDDPLICGVDVAGGGVAWNVAAFRRDDDARSIPQIRIPGECTRDRGVLVGKLSEILNDKRPGRKVAAMFIDMAFGSPIYERLCAPGFRNVHEVNFGQTLAYAGPRQGQHSRFNVGPHEGLATDRVDRDRRKDGDGSSGPGLSHQSEQPVGAGKQGGLQKRGQASPDDGDALALTFAQTVAPREAGRSRFAPNRRKKSATKTMNSAGIASTDPDPERGFDEAQIPQAPIRRFTEA